MNITTQLNGENVTIVDMNNNGHDLFITYVKENGDLTVQKLYNNPTSLINTVTTSATIVGTSGTPITSTENAEAQEYGAYLVQVRFDGSPQFEEIVDGPTSLLAVVENFTEYL